MPATIFITGRITHRGPPATFPDGTAITAEWTKETVTGALKVRRPAPAPGEGGRELPAQLRPRHPGADGRRQPQADQGRQGRRRAADLTVNTVDEAWQKRGSASNFGRNDEYVVDMRRTIGAGGERGIKILVEPGSSRFVTAHPVPF